MALESFGEGAYVIIRADGLGELADKVDECITKGYQPFQSLQVIPGANLRPTEFVQVVIKSAS